MKDTAVVTRARKKRRKRLLFYVATILFLFTVSVYLTELLKPVAVSADASEVVRVDIPKGSTATQIGKILEDNGLIKKDLLFRLLTRMKGYEDKYQAGTYIMSNDMDIYNIMDEMVEGRVYTETIKFTIPEGYETRQIADLLEAKGIADREDFLKEVRKGSFNLDFVKDIPERENRLEGYLFPDTYEVYVGESVRSIIQRMLRRFEEVAGEVGLLDWEDKTMGIDEIVTLASIIEREAASDSERPLVSAVFHNRLKIGQRLQSCATVQYILEERKPRLSNADTEIESPYNTYRVKGLPIGPIASPGAESLKAAMNPAQVDYLYFVVQKDGSHSFSDNYNDFLRDKRNSR